MREVRIQPTYEELKPMLEDVILYPTPRIQPTYEELKRDDAGKAFSSQLVSSLPMRN